MDLVGYKIEIKNLVISGATINEMLLKFGGNPDEPILGFDIDNFILNVSFEFKLI